MTTGDDELREKLLRDIYEAERDVRKTADALAEAHAALKEQTKRLPEYEAHEKAKQAFAEADAFLHGLIDDKTPTLFGDADASERAE